MQQTIIFLTNRMPIFSRKNVKQINLTFWKENIMFLWSRPLKGTHKITTNQTVDWSYYWSLQPKETPAQDEDLPG